MKAKKIENPSSVDPQNISDKWTKYELAIDETLEKRLKVLQEKMGFTMPTLMRYALFEGVEFLERIGCIR